VAKLCLGTAQFGFEYGIANQSGKPDDQDTRRILQKAVDSDIQYFDTAYAYGRSEEVLGRTLTELDQTHEINIITKLSPDFRAGSQTELSDFITETGRRLGVDRLYALLAHRAENIPDWAQFASHLHEFAGIPTVEYLGISVYEPEEAIKYAQIPEVDLIQVPMSPLDRRLLDIGFFETARENGKQVFIRSIFLQGLIFLKGPDLAEKGMSWAAPYLEGFWSFIHEENIPAAKFAWKLISQTVPDAWLVFGVETLEQLKRNIDHHSAEDLDDEIIQRWWSKLGEIPMRLVNPSLW